MKKTMKLAMLVCLALLACALVFTACDSGNDVQTPDVPMEETSTKDSTSEDNTPLVVTMVTRDEWKDAFDLSKYGNFILTVDELVGEGNHVWITKGTIESNNGTVYCDYVLKTDGEEEKIVFSEEGKLTSFEGFEALACMLGSFKDSASYGYTMFEYKEDNKSYYTNKVDMDGTPTDIKIWFEEGKIVKITIKGYDEHQEVDATYSISFDVVSK